MNQNKNNPEGIREALDSFRPFVESKLLLNQHKPHWSEMRSSEILACIHAEYLELKQALEALPKTGYSQKAIEAIVSECADVSAFSAMLASNMLALGVEPTVRPVPQILFEDVTPESEHQIDTQLLCKSCNHTFRQWKYVRVDYGGQRIFLVECPSCQAVGGMQK